MDYEYNYWCIMGGFVVIGYILRLLYDVFTVMVERVW